MAYCSKCGQELLQNNLLCGYCGAQPPGAPNTLTTDDLAIFIGKNSEKYLSKFTKFHQNGNDGFAATWNWSAFLVPFYWMLYRKLYLWALFVFVLGIIPIVNILSHIAFGVGGNFIYYKHARKKLREIDEARSYASEAQRAAAIARAGGVNKNILVILIAILIIAILAAIAIPRFSKDRMKGNKPSLEADTKNPLCLRRVQVCNLNPEFQSGGHGSFWFNLQD